MKPTLPRAMLCGLASALVASAAHAGPREQAFRMHSRLTGVPPAADTLAQMETMIAGGDMLGAAKLATAHPAFYNVTLKSWALPFTNKDISGRPLLNDYVATVIGMARDDVPFDQALYGDIVYVGKAGITGVPAFAANSNAHYDALDNLRVDLKANLEQQKQSVLTPGVTDISGLLTTRAFADAYFTAGTNRAAVRFSFMTFLCNDMEQMSDVTVPDMRIRQDVDRAPGGDAKVFRNKCAGCHAGMDGFAGAFAHFDYVNNAVVYDASKVADKYFNNATTFPDGYKTDGDAWVNLWTGNQNGKKIGWGGANSGSGVNEYGHMLAATEAFPTCMAKRVYSTVCMQDAATADAAMIGNLAAGFKSDNYNLKNLFATAATQCTGE